MIKSLFISFAIALSATPSTYPCSEAIAAQSLPLNQQAEEIASRLIGVMDTSEQAAKNSKVSNVQMTTCRISVPGATDGIYLYQEQAIAGTLSKPYRQRFLQIAPSAYSQSVRSLSFRPAESQKWINFCNQPETARVVQQSELGQPTCSVFLRRSNDAYIGRTAIDGCRSNYRGATRVRNQITLGVDRMETWDQGFDADGKQVWGARAEAYQFHKRQ